MKSFQAYHLLIFLSLIATFVASPHYAKRGCKDKCGNVRIPYPFGIGAKCSINKWYIVDCTSSTPYLPAVNHLEVLGIDLKNQTVTLNMPRVSECSHYKSVDLARSPFLFSKSQNKFVYEGCGNAVMMGDHRKVITGCSTTCRNDTVNDNNKCVGVSCCQTEIPGYLKSYSMSITGLVSQGGDKACGSAFLVDKNLYVKGRFSDNAFMPVSLLWTLNDLDHDKVSCCDNYEGLKVEVDLGNGTSIDTWKCYYYKSLTGNPYLFNGCYDAEECKRCEDNGGYCDYENIYDVDGLFNKWNITCRELIIVEGLTSNDVIKSYLGAILGAGIITVLVVLATIIYGSYKSNSVDNNQGDIFPRFLGSPADQMQNKFKKCGVEFNLLRDL
ncbi:wall-associated kinase family protein [Artemisia annua]|uniref:Wall-associated kinase family protein n=1 Tax=Artemisia annua TaxID=35608 RepID=A0A2U1Q667_ARTAN|nr:wall-associated kinase family protein [Artemisia annua]